MKKLLATLTLSALAVVTYGQGTFVGTININTAAGANTKRIQTPDGTAIGGTDYLVQLYYANGLNADESTLRAAAVPPISPRTGAAAGVLASAVYVLDGLTTAGGPVTLQLRAWSAALGANYEEAFAAWNAEPASDSRLLGKSATFNLAATGNPTAEPPITPFTIQQAFPGLTVSPVPEPGTYALGLLGLGLVALFRRRK
jgi:MYXO-CTERM domain-containing protein